MCGILGQQQFNSTHLDLTLFHNSIKHLEIRGPDHTGTYNSKGFFLTQTRLSVIDLNPRANQPMKYKHLVIAYNGEIYNFQELRTELQTMGHMFTTTSDTEVVLHAFEEWQEKCVEKFYGMWAFCIYNEKTEDLFLSRDRLGQKPLCFYKDKNKFIFSSEIPAITKLLSKKEKTPNKHALANFSTYNFQHIPAPYTAFKNIFKLEPGYNLIVKKGRIKKQKYLQLHSKPITSVVKEGEKILQETIQSTLNADAAIGVFLSGGVDSSLISSYISDKNITTFTIGYDRNDPEVIRAKKIAKKLQLRNEFLFYKDSRFEKNALFELQKIVKHYGEPIQLFQISYTQMILDMMKEKGIKVAVGGNGADEIFYGYDGANKQKRATHAKQFIDFFHLQSLCKFLPGQLQLLGDSIIEGKIKIYKKELQKKKYIQEKYKKFLYEHQFIEYSQEIPSHKLIDVYNWVGLRIENEHSITNVADIAGSIKGMEIRSPFLDKRVIDYSYNVPLSKKVPSPFSKKNNKWILKHILGKRIGFSLAKFKKMGYGYNIKHDDIIFKNKKIIRAAIQDVLPKLDLYNISTLTKMLDNHLEKKHNYSNQLLEVFLVSTWYKEEFL